MGEFGVGIDKEKALREAFKRLGIKPGDVVEQFIRSSGPGGQNVNKTSTCVYLKHIPTGISVKCGAQRSQALNRYRARVLLMDKIGSAILGEKSMRRQEMEKIRRQKRRRSRRAKQKMLEDKKMRGAKKSMRAPVKYDY
jgi:protein subunit release factor B